MKENQIYSKDSYKERKSQPSLVSQIWAVEQVESLGPGWNRAKIVLDGTWEGRQII